MIHTSRPLSEDEKKCKDCDLYLTCLYTNKLDYTGPEHPVFLLVGEAPGEEEDRIGKPFVGKAGKILHKVLSECGYERSEYGIVNSIRCWPGPGNPTPKEKHISACRKFLLEDVASLKPKVIIMLGNVALKALTRKSGITKIRGSVWEEDGIYYVPTFHPSSVNYDPSKLSIIIEDFNKAKQIAESGIKVATHDWKTILDFNEAVDFLESIKDRPIVYFDYETTGLRPWDDSARILVVSLCAEFGKSVCIPIYHKDNPFLDKADSFIEEFKRFILYRNDKSLPTNAFNAVFDYMYGNYLYDIPYPLLDFDPIIASRLIDEELKNPSLSQLTWIYTDIGGYDSELYRMRDENKSLYHPNHGGSYENFDLEFLGNYACGDADASFRIDQIFREKIHAENLEQLFNEIVLPASYSLIEYIKNGLKIDKNLLDKLEDKYLRRLVEIEEDCKRLPDVIAWKEFRNKSGKPVEEFSLTKNAHVGEVLFQVAKLPVLITTPGGAPSVSSDARKLLQGKHPLIDMLEEHASVAKIYSSYIKRWSEKLDKYGILHPEYRLEGTVTGRLSGDMQQIPRTDTNPEIKRLIVSRFDNGLMLNVDVKQAELRMAAIVSRDENLSRMFSEGKDPHAMAACLVYGLDYDKFMAKLENGDEDAKRLRTEMKSAVSFGLLYGRQAEAVAKEFGWSISKAGKFIRDYFAMFPGILRMIEKSRIFAMKHGYMRNIFGRKRRLPEASHAANVSEYEREKALRKAVNFVIQSSMHDLILYASHRVWSVFNEMKLNSKLCGEVHDSLIIDVIPAELDTVTTVLEVVFEDIPAQFPRITIPIEIEVSVGPNLADQKKIIG